MRKRLELVVEGRVQGVAFRAYTQDEAIRLGLAGWVCNLPDGSVELAAEGDEAALAELLAWARRGPPAARVTGVRVTWTEPRGELDFRVISGPRR